MSAILFDRDQVDRLDELPDAPGAPERLEAALGRHRPSTARPQDVAGAFDLDQATCDRWRRPRSEPCFTITAATSTSRRIRPSEEEDGELMPLECVVGKNWVITAHDRPIPVLEEFAERVSGSGDTGVLDGPAFFATLLEWVLGAYSAAFERVEQRLEEFDVQAMRGQGAEQDIEQLVGSCDARSVCSAAHSPPTAQRSPR